MFGFFLEVVIAFQFSDLPFLASPSGKSLCYCVHRRDWLIL